MAEPQNGSTPSASPSSSRRYQRLYAALGAESVDKKALAELAWSGVPEGLSRSEVWQLLLDYRPLSRERRAHGLRSKRQEYFDLRQAIYHESTAVCQNGVEEETPKGSSRSSDRLLLKQIRKDLPRTQACFGQVAEAPTAGTVVRSPHVQGMLERVLFVWAVRQPASGYVQGIDGILLFLVLIVLADKCECSPGQLSPERLSDLGEDDFYEVEADSYWCLSKLLSYLYDHYTEGFPGIQRMSVRLMELMKRIDPSLAEHLDEQGVDIFDTALRWAGCLMVRELPVQACARLWDALIAESAQPNGGERSSSSFESLLLYFCVCFMARYSVRLQEMDFETITMFLKAPTEPMVEQDVEILLGEAFVLKSMFHNAPSHLSSGSAGQPSIPHRP